MSTLGIGLLDYGMGNLTSVSNALKAVGAEVSVIETGEAARACDALILPGVGALGEGMAHLGARGFIEAIHDHARANKPLLGVCLGMQLLFETSEEHGRHEGLGLVKGHVRRLAPPPTDPPARVPHIGWNRVSQPRASNLLSAIKDQEAFYFVHSYVCEPADTAVIVGETEHGERFTSVIEAGAISAAQFHPEKSHRAGLQLLKTWVEGLS